MEKKIIAALSALIDEYNARVREDGYRDEELLAKIKGFIVCATAVLKVDAIDLEFNERNVILSFTTSSSAKHTTGFGDDFKTNAELAHEQAVKAEHEVQDEDEEEKEDGTEEDDGDIIITDITEDEDEEEENA